MKNQFLEITDPIHDFIRLNSTEQKIVDTSVFQRLRRIKQLSGAHLTYPGAQHTRFEHSLGVMHIAGMAANSLASKKQNRDKFEKNKEFSNKISQGHRKLAKKKRWKIVNASQSKNDVHNDVMKVVAKKMGL